VPSARHEPADGGRRVRCRGARFFQSAELGYLNPDRSITGLNAFADGVSGGELDGEPFDTRVDLDGQIRTWSLYATDTLPVGTRTHVTLSGRYNRTTIRNRDQITPGGGATSLDGDHTFGRFKPRRWSDRRSVIRGRRVRRLQRRSRAATSIELGCANPEQPCKLPNALAGDPPLDQVVTRTAEGGLRGTRGPLAWHAGVFLAANRNDILFVMSDQTGFGYFRNFGQTRRQGFELGARTQAGRVAAGAEYTFLHATFESEERVNGESNSTNDAAEAGVPGVEGQIAIGPGDRLPLVPRHLLKMYVDLELTSRLNVAVNLIGSGGLTARGNENDQHEPDGVYYLGEGGTAAYAVVNLGGRYRLTSRVDLIAQANNLFDRRYATAAQLGPGRVHRRRPVPGETVPAGRGPVSPDPHDVRGSRCSVPRVGRGARALLTRARTPHGPRRLCECSTQSQARAQSPEPGLFLRVLQAHHDHFDRRRGPVVHHVGHRARQPVHAALAPMDGRLVADRHFEITRRELDGHVVLVGFVLVGFLDLAGFGHRTHHVHAVVVEQYPAGGRLRLDRSTHLQQRDTRQRDHRAHQDAGTESEFANHLVLRADSARGGPWAMGYGHRPEATEAKQRCRLESDKAASRRAAHGP
jgi:hypothetical protein